MEDKALVNRGKEFIKELVRIVHQLSDEDVVQLLGTGSLNDLLKAILDPAQKSEYSSLNEFLLANKGRATLIALLHYAITHNYSFKGINNDGVSGFISPSYLQWFDDGVMFMQGKKRFAGLLGLYKVGRELSYAIMARDAKAGEALGLEDFEFIDHEEFSERLRQMPQKLSNLEEPIQKLQTLLNEHNNDESKYQELLIHYPWVLGAEYKQIQRHTKLDERNIPDFTAVRVVNGCRDILEIKPPFTKMFRDNGELSANFHNAWNQAERYLDFARRDEDYLQRKGFRFDNPKCYLILGHDFTDKELEQVRTKERMNPAIRLLTYNDLLVFIQGTIAFIEDLRAAANQSDEVENS